MTLVSAEHQTMNYYMNLGNRPDNPLARGVYLEIVQIEKQHVSHYESCLDPADQLAAAARDHECWLYWSRMQTEVDPRIQGDLGPASRDGDRVQRRGRYSRTWLLHATTS